MAVIFFSISDIIVILVNFLHPDFMASKYTLIS